MLHHPQIDRFGNAIETQIIQRNIDLSKQSALQFFELHFVDGAFKYRLLDTLTDAFAGFCDTPESFASSRAFGRHIIGHDNQQANPYLDI